MLKTEVIMDEEALAEMCEVMGEKISRMFNFFMEDSVSYMSSIKAGYESEKIEEIIEASHSLKSSSELIGALRLSAKAKEIEMNSRGISKGEQGSLQDLGNDIEELESILEVTLKRYSEYREEHNI